jgi:hypothetical protein
MAPAITLRQTLDCLEKAGVHYAALELDGASIIISEYGGRILGPFWGAKEKSLLWMNKAFQDTASFKALIQKKDWNIGGDRFWVAPELPFFVTDKNDFFSTYNVQASLDPGNYAVQELSGSITLSQDVTLAVYEEPIGTKKFHMERSVKKIINPLLSLADADVLMKDITYFGFSQNISLLDTGEDALLYLEPWVLTQINPPGKLIVPFTGILEYVDYYEPINKSLFTIKDQCMIIDVTGEVRYKLGFKSIQTTGRAAYLGLLDGNLQYLLVKNYFNNPSNIYSAAPSWNPKQYGCSLFLFNDSGTQGGFAEFETCGTTISGTTGLARSENEIYYYFFIGMERDLLKIAKAVL